MRRIVLRDEEYAILHRLLRAIPPAQLSRILPNYTGVDMHYFRCLLTSVLKENFHFPKSDGK